MGTFTYNSTLSVDFEDRILFHLQVVITAKLRRGESFMFSWSKPESVGGRTSVWLDRHLPVTFDFVESTMPSLNRHWTDQLMEISYRASGLQVIPETSHIAPQRTPQLTD